MADEDQSWRGLRYWERLKWARLHAGYSKAAPAARDLGFDAVVTYTAYERSPNGTSKHTPLNMQRAKQFGEHFGVRWQWLLDDNDAGTPFEGEDPGTGPWRRIQNALSKATPAEQEMAADVVERLMRGTAND